jgi:hypothetical protein
MRKMSRLGSALNLSTRDWREVVEVEPSRRLQGKERERQESGKESVQGGTGDL